MNKIISKEFGSEVSLYCIDNRDIDEIPIKAFFIDDNNIIETLDLSDCVISEVNGELKYTSITAPQDNGGYIFGTFGYGSFCINVESEKRRVILNNYDQNIEENIPFYIFSNSGIQLQSGTLNKLSDDFYEIELSQPVIDAVESSIFIDGYDSIPINKIVDTAAISAQLKGDIRLESDVWQLISIPVPGVKVKEYFCDRLAAKYNVQAEDIIEICAAYFGDENKFRSFIPGVTNPETSNNYPLVHDDVGSNEISGMWVKMKDLSALGGYLIYDWEIKT